MWPALALAALLSAGPAPAAGFPRGQIVERVAVADTPSQSYALYLPSAYTPEKLWPVLYMLDARGNALVPLERFQAAAERYGWVLVSSYNSRSDTRDDPNSPAMTAMWNDAVKRFSIDGRRVYASGFSGGARAAVAMAYDLPGQIAGVVGAGAGFADSSAPVKKVPFVYFGTVGDRDMNYYEMRSLEEKLEAAKVPHRIVYFEGGHTWMSPELAGEAVAWMELQAMKSGVRAKDAGTIAALQSAARSRAAALEAEGRRTEAFLAYTHAVEDFRGLADVTADEAKARELGKLPEVQAALKDARKRDARDEATLRSVNTKLRNALAQSEPPLPARLAADLGIPELRKKAASGVSRGAALGRPHPREPARPDRLLSSRTDVPAARHRAGARPAAGPGRDRPRQPPRLLQRRGRRRAHGRRVAGDQGPRGRRRQRVPAFRADRRGHRLRSDPQGRGLPQVARGGAAGVRFSLRTQPSAPAIRIRRRTRERFRSFQTRSATRTHGEAAATA